MKDDEYYLLPNVVIEPLINNWYAWTHLLFPPTAALNLSKRHLRIMDSYIRAPHIHREAVKNEKMKGGPFMDFGTERVADVIQLRERIIAQNKPLIEMAAAIESLNALLAEEATGYSMDHLYEKIPALLRGYVELIYDLSNHPSYRFFEALLYKSEFYLPATQSLGLWITNNDERPFALSTPRLEDASTLQVVIPFSDSAIDKLSAMKRKAGPRGDIMKKLHIAADKQDLFNSFFTKVPPKPYQKYEGDKIRMRYFGHACILIETGSLTFLIDPLISYYGYHSELPHYSDLDLPETIDYILITHNHQDHILFETLLPLRYKVKNIIVPRTSSGALQDPNVRQIFNAAGFKNVSEIGEMESLVFDDCTITGVPFIGEHSDLNVQSKICHHVRIGDFSILFAADSCNIEPRLYQLVQRQLGNLDTLFLGMECDGAPLSWLYGPLLPKELERDKDQSRRLAGSDFQRGKWLVDAFNPNEVYVYAMGQEPWVEFISSIKYTEASNPIVASDKLIKYCRSNGKIAERLYGEKELLYKKDLTEILI
jgi:L-ascorbate metabolism protein UlaG (beta-lactamase superfamily)